MCAPESLLEILMLTFAWNEAQQSRVDHTQHFVNCKRIPRSENTSRPAISAHQSKASSAGARMTGLSEQLT